MLFKKYKFLFIFLLVSSLLYAAALIGSSYLFQNLITMLKQTNQSNELFINLGIYLGVFLAQLILGFSVSFLLNFTYFKLERRLSFSLFKDDITNKNIVKSYKIDSHTKVYALTKAMESNALSNGVAFMSFFNSILAIAAITAFLAVVAPLTLLYITPLAIFAIVVPLFFKRASNRYGDSLQTTQLKPYQYNRDALKALKTYRLNSPDKLLKWYEHKFQSFQETYVKDLAKKHIPITFSGELTYYTVFLLIILFTMLVTAKYDVGVISIVLMSAKNLADKGVTAAKEFYALNNSSKITKKTYLDLNTIVDEEQPNTNLLDQRLEFPHSFKSYDLFIHDYNIYNLAFKNIRLSIKKGQKILIQGNSGTGKSLLLKMLSGLTYNHFPEIEIYRNDQLINHQDLEYYNLYNDFYYLTSDTKFIEEPLLYNISFGDKLQEKRAKFLCHSFGLKMLDLQKTVNPNALEFSQGQMQRLGIVQALCSNKKFLIFDESFSNIDAENTSLILQYLSFCDDLTIIMVSNTVTKDDIKYFDHVYELKNGGLHENA
ncbi:ATP-binding cassette domain-containing protein [Mycoplasma corogypsi]|uniref:ATP-binding cassette domain-containing protein n=1 Tax=Mycoplasma corogypsi TaxID=2106 RepID=UPI003872E31D